MTQEQTAAIVRAHGMAARTDGLGNVQALMGYDFPANGGIVHGQEWITVPGDSADSLLSWLGH